MIAKRIPLLLSTLAMHAAAQDKPVARWLAEPTARHTIPAYQPALRLEVRQYAKPRPLRVWIAEVDVRHPDVSFVLTEPKSFDGDDAKFETGCSTTLAFAEKHDVSLAINTSAFQPYRLLPDQPMDVVGLGVVAGERFSPPHNNLGALLIDREKRVAMQEPPFPEQAWHAVAGFRMLLDDGRVVVDPKRAASSFGGINPRTAVGTDRDGKRLWIVVVDGRQPDVSMGVTLLELADLFRHLGAWDALNLDGGGSTTLVLRNRDGQPQVINTPVGLRAPGSLRMVANNLGLRLPGHGPKDAELPDLDGDG